MPARERATNIFLMSHSRARNGLPVATGNGGQRMRLNPGVNKWRTIARSRFCAPFSVVLFLSLSFPRVEGECQEETDEKEGGCGEGEGGSSLLGNRGPRSDVFA